MIPVRLIIKLVIGLIIVSSGVGFYIYIRVIISQNKSLKSELKSLTIEKEQVEADRKTLMLYIAKVKELKEVQSKDLQEFNNAKDKHKIVNDMLDNLNAKLSEH